MKKFFEVTFRGKEVLAEVGEDDKYFIPLPQREKDGKTYYEYITRSKLGAEVLGEEIGGWEFVSSRKGDPDYKFSFWILDDGRRICNNPDKNPEQYRELPGKFSRTATPKTSSEELSRDVYDTIKQLYEINRLGVKAEEIGELRTKTLDTLLKILGYSSPSKVKFPMSTQKSYFALRRIGKFLEGYRSLAFVSPEEREDGTKSFLVDYDGTPNREKVIEDTEETTKQLENAVSFIQEQDEWVRTVREISRQEDFYTVDDYSASNADRGGYSNYARMIRKTAQLLLGLNYDLLSKEDRSGISDLTTLYGIELEDEISSIIDSSEFEAACSFEDKLMIQQCESVEKPLSEAASSTGFSTVLRTSLEKVYRSVVLSRSEKQAAIREYNIQRNILEGRDVKKERARQHMEEARKSNPEMREVLDYSDNRSEGGSENDR